MPITWSTMIQAGLPAGNMQTFATLLDTFQFEEEIGNSLVVKEPVGVVGAITPWNYPLHQIICKVGGALAAGCTIVLKPSEIAPLNAFILAEIVHDVGLPAGVFNLVTGTGPVVGEAIAAHPDVDMVSFTGSTRAGKRVAEVAIADRQAGVARTRRQVGEHRARRRRLRDGDPEGRVRLLPQLGPDLHRPHADARAEQPLRRGGRDRGRCGSQTQVDDPTKEGMHLGPLISQAQWDRVQGYIQQGIDEGAVVAAGGLGKPEGKETGYFVKPTVFANVTNDMTVAQEEIFGPVLSIIGYDDDDDAVRIANDSLYGLSGGVWSGDQERAIAVARRMRTGAVDVNGGSFNIAAPFGGYKQSGYGRENGVYGIDEFLQTKSLQL